MIIFSEYTGFCHMISFYINCFGSSTFRAVSDNKSESLKFVTIRLCNVSVINVYNRFLRSPFTDSSKIRFKSCGGSAVVLMSGQPFNRIDLFSVFVKMVNDVGKEAAF